MYEELLETDNAVWVHFQNVQVLVIELYKAVNEFSPDIMKDAFSTQWKLMLQH